MPVGSELEKPGVKVFQEFVTLSPTLIRPTLQEVLIGIARQVEVGETAGTYAGVETTYAYPDLLAGATVDTTSVEVYLQTADGIFDITTESGVVITTSGVTVPANLIPSSTKIEDQTIQTVLAGTTFTDGNTDFFAANVQAGDVLTFVTGSSAAAALGVNASVNDNTGGYVILEVSDQNTLILDTALVGESNVAYSIDSTSVADGTVLISYVATRTDGVGTYFEFQGSSEAETLLGLAVPENPLGLAASIAVANNDRVIGATMVASDTTSAHLDALDILESKEVYAMVPLTQNEAIHQVYQSHVDLMSLPDRKKERMVLINKEIDTELEYQDTSTSGSVTGSTWTDSSAQFVTNEVPVGSYIELEGTPAEISIDGTLTDTIRIASIVSETEVEIVGSADSPTSGLTYVVNSGTLSKAQIARNLAGYAFAFNDRRVVVVEPDELETSIARESVTTGTTSSSAEWVEGFYACSAIGGMISGLAPAQPFTTLPIAGFTDLRRANNFFSDTQLGVIRGGGIMMLEQAVPSAPITIQHQLTTAVSAIETRELSIVKAVDYASKYIRERLSPLVGRNNITDIFIDQAVRTTIYAIINDLIQTNTIGSGTQILRIVQSETQPDTIEITIDYEVLYPANYINVTLLI
jgi:hypothetical protein